MNRLEPRLILSVKSGHSPLVTREFTWGARVEPFSVGSGGEWLVAGQAVDATHLFLAFDGYRLYAASASPAHDLFVDGRQIGNEWTHVPVPSLLSFGGANIAVECEDAARGGVTSIRPCAIIDLSRADRQPTQVVDLSRTLQLHTARLEIPESMLAELRAAPAPEASPQASTMPMTEVVSSHRGDTLMFQAPFSSTFGGPPVQSTVEGARVATELVNTLYDGGALRERASGLAGAQSAETAGRAVQSVAIPAERPAFAVLRRSLAAYRRSSLPKQLAIALLPFAIAGVWMMQGASASVANTGAPMPGMASVRAVGSATVSATEVRPAAAGAPSTARPPAEAPGKSNTVAQAAGETAAPHDPGERLALVAAFSGNKAEAAALYDQLATSRSSRVFALAARLIRTDRVRKP